MTSDVPGRVLALDYGTVRVGVALSDGLRMTARALVVLDAKPQPRCIQRVAELAAEHEATLLVVGMPRNMDGSRHASAGRVEAFARQCATRAGLPLEYEDERLTTVEAERVLGQRGLSRKGRKARIDMTSAAVLLKGWLDRQPG